LNLGINAKLEHQSKVEMKKRFILLIKASLWSYMVGYTGLESNPGCWDENPWRNLLDHPDTLKNFN